MSVNIFEFHPKVSRLVVVDWAVIQANRLRKERKRISNT